MRPPPVEAEQDRSIRIQNLTEVVVSWKRLGLAEQRLGRCGMGGKVAIGLDRGATMRRRLTSAFRRRRLVPSGATAAEAHALGAAVTVREPEKGARPTRPSPVVLGVVLLRPDIGTPFDPCRGQRRRAQGGQPHGR